MDLRNFLDQLLVVIVIFKIRPEETVALKSLQTAFNVLQSFPDIFLYDNSPHPSQVPGNSITYIHDPLNSGVSRAYNAAAVHAASKGKQWLLLLDQDTHVSAALFEKFGSALHAHPRSVIFVPLLMDARGLLSPFRFERGRGRRIDHPPGRLPLEKYRFVNSGILVRHSAFLSAGGYDERIPLDFSDISFGERLKSITKHFDVIDVPLQHHFSNEHGVSLEDALARFQYFCTGALRVGRNSGALYLYLLRIFLRAGQLSLRYKNPRFIFRLFKLPAHD